MKKYSLLLGLLLTAVCLLPERASSQEWWQMNSLKGDSIPESWRFHVVGNYTFDRVSGTLTGFQHEGLMTLFIRKKRFLFISNSEINYRKIELGPDAVREKYMYLDGSLIYDLTPHLHAEAGVIWEKDEPQLIDQRLASYAGLNVEVLSKPAYGLNILGALGEERELSVLDGNVDVTIIGYAQQNFRLQLHPNIIFSERFIFVQGLRDTSYYRYLVVAETVFRFTPIFSALISHETKYDRDPIQADLERMNHTQAIGLRFEF